MEEHKCPYSGTLVSEQFACVMAKPVVRRGDITAYKLKRRAAR